MKKRSNNLNSEKNMRILCTGSVFILFVGLLASCDKGEREILKNEVPGPVLLAFSETYPDAEVREYSVESTDGEKFYEIAFHSKGRRIDVKYSADGRLIEIEERIQESEMPENIQNTLRKHFSRYQVNKVEKVYTGGEAFFEVRIISFDKKARGKKRKLKFSEDGQLLKSIEKDIP